MAFCKKCGAEIKDDAKFCPSCGAGINDFSSTVSNLNNTADYTSSMDASDIENNKVMGVLAYLSWLVLIPLFVAKDSKFARFHTNQGLILAIIEIIWWVIEGVLSTILFFVPIVGPIVIALLGLVNIPFLVLMIVGIVNAVTGKAKELPLIGKIRIIK